MLSKEKIKLLCDDMNFVQDFIRYNNIREVAKRLIKAINVIEGLNPNRNHMPECYVDMAPARKNYKRILKVETAHNNLLEDVYGLTWHGHKDVISILTDVGKM
jgi:hypothetical protein